jgi:large subunit ribosomal protein L29
MKASELKDLSVEEVQSKKVELLNEQFKMRMNKSMGQLEQTHEIKNIRRDIARCNTILTQKAGK